MVDYLEHSDTIIKILLFVNLTVISVVYKFLSHRFTKFEDKLEQFFCNQMECKSTLKSFVTRDEIDSKLSDICHKIDNLKDLILTKYRTKEEAQKDWNNLERRLISIEQKISKLN